MRQMVKLSLVSVIIGICLSGCYSKQCNHPQKQAKLVAQLSKIPSSP